MKEDQDSYRAPGCLVEGGLVRAETVQIDLLGMVAWVDGEQLELQPLQVRILAMLTTQWGRPVTNRELSQRVFRTAQTPGSTGIARQVCALRSALGHHRNLLRTVRGGAYVLGTAGEEPKPGGTGHAQA